MNAVSAFLISSLVVFPVLHVISVYDDAREKLGTDKALQKAIARTILLSFLIIFLWSLAFGIDMSLASGDEGAVPDPR